MINGHHVIRDRVGFGDNIRQVLQAISIRLTKLKKNSQFWRGVLMDAQTGLCPITNNSTTTPLDYKANRAN
jgi:hypothetical protein